MLVYKDRDAIYVAFRSKLEGHVENSAYAAGAAEWEPFGRKTHMHVYKKAPKIYMLSSPLLVSNWQKQSNPRIGAVGRKTHMYVYKRRQESICYLLRFSLII